MSEKKKSVSIYAQTDVRFLSARASAGTARHLSLNVEKRRFLIDSFHYLCFFTCIHIQTSVVIRTHSPTVSFLTNVECATTVNISRLFYCEMKVLCFCNAGRGFFCELQRAYFWKDRSVIWGREVNNFGERDNNGKIKSPQCSTAVTIFFFF